MSAKNPLFIDLDRSIVGTYIGIVEIPEKQHVKIKYCPPGIFPREIVTDYTVPLACVYKWLGKAAVPGAESQIIAIFGSKADLTDSDFGSVVNFGQQKLIRELQEKVAQLQIEVETNRMGGERASAGVEQTLSQYKKIDEAAKKKSPFETGGLGGFEQI